MVSSSRASDSVRSGDSGTYEASAEERRAKQPSSGDGPTRRTQPQLGTEAQWPHAMPGRGWKQILLRVKDQITEDRLSMIAGGIAFYGFLALFPALAGVISIWGIVADPAQVEGQIATLSGALPTAALDLVREAALRIASTSSTDLSGGVLLSLLLTFWSANKGTKGIVEGITIAYDEDPNERGFIKENLISLGLTVGATVLCVVTLGVVVVLPPVLERLWFGGVVEGLLRWARWPLLALLISTALALVYRFAPPRRSARWRWITPGSTVAILLWLAASAAFSYYTQNFGSYDKTYGSLAAVAVLLMWFYISAFIVLLGAELNAELEKQTARDTTTLPDRAMGSRGAVAADQSVPLSEHSSSPHPRPSHAD